MADPSFARIVRRRRDTLGLSQARLGELVGRSASTIRNWERGTATPAESSDVVALAAVLGVAEVELLERAGFEPAEIESSFTLEESFASLTAETRLEGPPPAAAGPPRSAPDATLEGTVGEAEDADAGTGSGAHPDDATGSEPGEEPPLSPAGAPPLPEWMTREPEVEIPRRRLRRAAPPTVLESAPVGEPSYIEEPSERRRYRIRALATAAVVLGLLIVLLWSFDRSTDALGSMWDDLIEMLTI